MHSIQRRPDLKNDPKTSGIEYGQTHFSGLLQPIFRRLNYGMNQPMSVRIGQCPWRAIAGDAFSGPAAEEFRRGPMRP
jgi:hypothetical protein